MADQRHFPVPRPRPAVDATTSLLSFDRMALIGLTAFAAVGSIVYGLLARGWGVEAWSSWASIAVVCVGASAGLVAALLGSTRTARAALLAALWLSAAIPVAVNGWQASTIPVFLIAVVLAAATLGARAAVAVVALSLVLFVVVTVRQPGGWTAQMLVTTPRRPVGEVEVFLFGALVVVWWSWRSERAAREQARLAGSAAASETLQLAVESSRAGVGVCDLRGRLTYVNRSLLAMWRAADPREVLGRDIYEFWQDPDEAREQTRRIAAGEIDLAMLVGRRADGSVFDVEMSAAPVVGDDGRVRGYIGSFLDVTERNIAEHQLEVERERTRAIIESVLDIVIVLDTDGRIVFENAAVGRVLGFGPGERIGSLIFDHAHPDDLVRGGAAMAKLMEDPDQAVRVPMRFRHKDGSWRWLETVGRNLTHVPAIGGILGVAHDITEQRDLQARLEAGDRLETVGRLAGGVAHDFNNLLTAILGNAELARALPGGAAPLTRYLDGVIQAGERARDLTRKLLAFARRERTQPVVIDVATRVAEAGDLLARLLGGEIRLDVKIGDEPLPVLIDPVQFEQILLNLAVNARDAMPIGGTFAIRAERLDTRDPDPTFIGALPAGPVVRMLVRDTGHGMTPEIMARIFEPFFTTKELGRGTGLGLSTVYGSVSQAQGAIRVASRLGEGTTFEIVFPLAPADAVAVEAPAPAPVEAATVLVVDDDAEVRGFVEEVLVSAGFRVLTAIDGQDGMRVIDAHADDIAVLLTDVVMPNGGGAEVAAHFRGRRPGGQIVFITGFTFDASFEAQAAGLGAPILSKPFTIDQLLGRVRTQLARAQSGGA